MNINNKNEPNLSANDEAGRGFQQAKRQPAFNVPGIILFTITILVAVHLYRMYFLSISEDQVFLFTYAFFPIRLDPEIMARFGDAFPGGLFGTFTSFFTYGFLHADWLHLTVNGFWLLIFGSALARRIGVSRFILISLVGSIAGALLHLVTNWSSSVPMVGASAAISAHMACAARFAFVAYGPLGRPRSDHPSAYFLPALSIGDMMKNVQVVGFLGIWFAVNLIFGLGSGVVEGESSVAWQAHIGGFLAGLFLFPMFDPVQKIR